jgi:hypothetical protein
VKSRTIARERFNVSSGVKIPNLDSRLCYRCVRLSAGTTLEAVTPSDQASRLRRIASRLLGQLTMGPMAATLET